MTIFEMLTFTAMFCFRCFFSLGQNNFLPPHAPTPPPSPQIKHEREIDWEMVDEDAWGVLLGEKHDD